MSYPSLFSPFIGPLSKLLSISLLALPHLKTKVHRSKPIDKTVLILETLLGHIEGFLHRHGECHAESYNEAAQYEADVYEVDMMGWTSGRANKRQLFKVSKSIVDK